MHTLHHFGLLLASIVITTAPLEERFKSFEPSKDSLPLSNARIFYSADDFAGVDVAVSSLVTDLDQTLGSRPLKASVTLQNVSEAVQLVKSETAIIVGSLSHSFVIQELLHAGKFDAHNIQHKWETFQTSVVTDPRDGLKRALVVAGSHMRGTRYGVYTLCEQAGQSPFWYWTDTPAQTHDELYAIPQRTVHGPPSIKYRGLFINDEAPSMTTWWSQRNNKKHHPLDAAFYTHVFDMMLRLKANFLWPTMWKSANNPPGNVFFTDDPANMALAKRYGIIISTSHHEPMQRATNEWNASETGPWDWSKNKANVTRFMDAGVRRAADRLGNASYITLGMRGAGDGPVQGSNASDILQDVFQAQRDIIARYFGAPDAVPQVWTIYKEVATYYAAGLTPPDDVTLMLTDDNWGNIQRLPLDVTNETSRSGGTGIYYHLEYVGAPRAYKWQDYNFLPKLLKELSQACMQGAQQIWVINVGDIKPMELPYGFVMDLAWNTSSITFESIPDYLRLWATRKFGSACAHDIAELVLDWNQLLGVRRFEMITPDTYSLQNYDGVDRVLAAWDSLAEREVDIYGRVDRDRRATFFH